MSVSAELLEPGCDSAEATFRIFLLIKSLGEEALNLTTLSVAKITLHPVTG
jgi:hypothetical protein